MQRLHACVDADKHGNLRGEIFCLKVMEWFDTKLHPTFVVGVAVGGVCMIS